MSEPGERPRRWTFTWLLRIQRGGKDPLDMLQGVSPPSPDRYEESREHRYRYWAAIVLGFVIAVELAIGVWLDIIPR